MKLSRGEKVFSVMNYVLLALLALATLYPFWYVLVASVSDSTAVITGEVVIWPKDFTFSAYARVFEEKGIWMAYANTIFYTVVGTAVNLLFTILGAYPLSKKRLMGRTFLSFFIAFTMWFRAGIVPTYLNFRSLHLLDTRTSVIIGFAVATFYVILMRTYFQSIPEALEESAKLDGANDLQILAKIYLPLSVPTLMTIGLYYAVDRWNGYFWAMILLSDEKKIPLQVLLTGLLLKVQGVDISANMVDTNTYSKETMVYATIIVAILPIVAVYPFIQKYFSKGLMVGAVKG